MNYVRANNMKTVTIVLIFSSLALAENTETYISQLLADLWVEGADIVKIMWRDCSRQLVNQKDEIDHKEHFPTFLRCIKRKTLRALDKILSLDLVPIADGVNLVKFDIVDSSGNVVPVNDTRFWNEKYLDDEDWRTLVLQRLARVLRTHVIKFDFPGDKNVDKVEQRGRRRYHMLTMMMFGIVSIGMVLIPMGFQFLAVLGGKALLLAKMALILASIQGLKKIASSPLSYGFYHTYPPYDHFERRSYHRLKPRHIAESNQIKTSEERLIYPGSVAPSFTKNVATNLNPNIAPTQNIVSNLSPYVPPNVLDTPLKDLTTIPGEVQADYALELPYNGLNFQSSSPVVSA